MKEKNNTKTVECDSGYIMLTSNPPQYRCINCGKIWSVTDKTPMCAKGGPKLPETFEQMHNMIVK